MRAAAAEGAQVILLQELFRTTYFCQDQDASRFDWAQGKAPPAILLSVAMYVHPWFDARRFLCTQSMSVIVTWLTDRNAHPCSISEVLLVSAMCP